MSGPLQGLRVVELGGIGPGPFAAMVLADMGAEVIRIERPSGQNFVNQNLAMNRSRPGVVVDLRHPDGVDAVLRLVARADALIDPYRPGVTERLGVGPQTCLVRNPRLIYCRITGFGQEGPLATCAGHDINYLSMSGLLHAVGRSDSPPVPPLNLVADFAGGGLLLAFAVVAGVLEARSSGKGQTVDVSMLDAAALSGTFIYGLLAAGMWSDARANNLLDGANPVYDTYETADGQYLAVGALEPEFQSQLFERLGYDGEPWFGLDHHDDWPARKAALTAIFRQRTRAEWLELLEGCDACVTPVLSLHEAPMHEHNRVRGTFADLGGVIQPAPAPRFSRTPGRISSLPAERAALEEVLAPWGFDGDEVAALRAAGILG